MISDNPIPTGAIKRTAQHTTLNIEHETKQTKYFPFACFPNPTLNDV